MIAGSLSLGGKQVPAVLPVTSTAHTLIEGRVAHRVGHWFLATDLESDVLSIPSRDKQVTLIGHMLNLRSKIEVIDSSQGENYLAKLIDSVVLDAQDPLFSGVLVNHNTSTHSSMAFATRSPIYFYGVHDQQADHSYLVWSSEEDVLNRITAHEPMRYLIYRFPVLENGYLFLPFEAVCAKWWRWSRSGTGLLAFNALERRLFGPLGK